ETRMRTRLLPLLAALALLAGCGDPTPGPAAPPDQRDRTRAAILEIIELARADNGPGLAARVVYRGDDPARRWKSVCNYADPEEKRYVDSTAARIKKDMVTGELAFVEWRSETESEGTWLVWKVKGATAAWFACLDIDGTVAVGDIDRD
ncbi:MAG: hypothetical protein O2894_11360, partial [Planctomycetota bacterium]|nr:hypothetical protein [Planctomycetota bacterium]